MSIPTYVLGYPPDGSSLGNTKAQIRSNLDGTFLTLSVDHQNANQPTPGYHNVIHMLPHAAPAAIPNVGQLLQNVANDGFATDTTFFFETGLGLLLQLTRNIQPIVATNGTTFLPGGLILQWGIVVTPFATPVGTVNFATANKNFPNNCFNVQTTMIGTSGTANIVQVTNFTNTNFGWKFTGPAGTSFTGFFWTAIGF